MSGKNIFCKWIILIGMTFFTGCSTTEKIEKPISFSVYLGGSKGGFIEEPDIDAISGATNTVNDDSGRSSLKFCAGLHVEYKINNQHKIETGLDFIPHQQSIFYKDPQLNYYGRLDVDYYRLSLPLTYNFSVLKNKNKNTIIYIKGGFALNYIHSYNTRITGIIPDFSINKFAITPLFALTLVPVKFNDYSLGLFFNTSLLKGTKVFTDEIYHKGNKTGLMSTLEMGIYINFNK